MNIKLYLIALVCLFANQLSSQETFESRASAIAKKIETIKNEEKIGLKHELEKVNTDLEKGNISKEEADLRKQKLAEQYAKFIEDRVAKVQLELNDLVQQKVEGKIKEGSFTTIDNKKYTGIFYINNNDTIQKSKTSKCPNRDEEKLATTQKEKRTTSQLVLSFGANNLVTNKSIAKSDFYYWLSHYFEWGATLNTRILKNHNLLHAKYGFSVMYNSLYPTENRHFVADPNNQAHLEVFPHELESSRLKNIYFTTPVHLEFDFTKKKIKDGISYFRTQQGFRFGIGGYQGFRIKSKQKLYYKEDDIKVRIKQKANFNANDYIYGLSTYIGYKAFSLYCKYDLNPLFENNPTDQRNISLGLRVDLK